MAGESSETLHTLVITAVKDETTRVRVAHVLSRVTKDVSAEYIRDRMAGLPWTITRKATRKKAIRLVQLLERVGATVKVTPPLEEGFKLEMGETRLVPGTDLLTRTQMITSEELVRAPAKGVTEKPGLSNRSPAAPSPKKPTPPEPSSETQFEAGFEIGPLSLSGILDRSFRICRAHFWRLLAILAIPWLVTVAVMLAMMMVLALAGFTAKAIDKSSVDTLLLL
ncbi:MAG: hypothetical protein FJY85_22445, partial [Deltaproteobacteria bacterium]|nr:hypothetical protein [Deltaproteobacteria bacterium]